MSNTAVFTCADGRVEKFPLDYLFEHKAMLVTKINGEHLPESVGGTNQLWIPSAPARLFVRNIISIDFSNENEAPPIPNFEADDMRFTNRPNIAVKIKRELTHPIGLPIHFEGYADDFDRRIAAVQFSLDCGETWTTYAVENATSDRWVYWKFDYTPNAAGTYMLQVKSINEDGERSPLSAVESFVVK